MKPTARNSDEIVKSLNSVLRTTKTSLDWMLFIEIVIVLTILFFAFSPAGRAQNTPPDPSLAGSSTDCGPRGTNYRIKWEEPYLHPDLASGQRRWGPCFGVSSALCRDLGNVCISTEAERNEATGILLALTAGRCDPPRGTLFPSEQTLYDWTLAFRGMDKLRSKYRALGCDNPPPPPPTTTCPTGEACRPPCPACPVCPICPPASSCVPSIGIPPLNTLLVIWDTRTTPPARRMATWIGDRYLTWGGAEIEPAKVSRWLAVPD